MSRKQVKTRWEKSADRENERRRKKNPLFVATGLVPLATPEERRERVEGGRARSSVAQAERRAREEATALERRAVVAAAVSPEVLAALDEQRAVLPKTPEYTAGFWHEQAIALGLAPAPPTFDRRSSPALRQAAYDARRQLPLFEPPPPMPSLDAVPEVPDPCPVCGWTGVAAWPSPKPVHPVDCTWFQAFILGMWAKCAACAQRRRTGETRAARGPCEKHLGDTTRCRDEGHVHGPPPRDYLSGIYCTRCLIYLGKEAA